MRTRTYSELLEIETFEDRYDYLALSGKVGGSTFGHDRYLNQTFYTSREWRDLRRYIIVRDQGCDLAVPDYEIHDRVYIHHMNPMTVHDLVHRDEANLDPEYLISVSFRTHNAIHFGNRDQLPKQYNPRRPGDTKLW